MLCSVIIPFFSDLVRHQWVLEGLCRQSVSNFEVLVGIDGEQNAKVVRMVEQYRNRLNLSIHVLPGRYHLSRVSAVRNLCARYSSGDLLIFLDGDVVPDVDLVISHSKSYDLKISFYGFRRFFPMHLVKAFSGQIDYGWMERSSYLDPRLVQSFHDNSLPQWMHYYACNYSLPASLYCKLGGHDERYVGWGGEDMDLGRRLLLAGCRIYPIWGGGVVTHLDHDRAPIPDYTDRPWESATPPICSNGSELIRTPQKRNRL